MNFMQELRALVEQLEVEEEAESPSLVKLTEDDRQKEDDQLINMSLTLSETQHKTMLGYYRRLLTDSDNEDLLRFQHSHAFSFLKDIHRLCELLAQEPIEVSAGPQEERQQTTADVIDEVERQLTQLGTGEVFCALLQEDRTLSAAKTTLLAAPKPTPAGDPALIERIRTRSRQRFSRSRVEIDAKTAARRAIATPPVQTTPPPQQETAGTPTPPSAQARQPRPESPRDTGPPIGRR